MPGGKRRESRTIFRRRPRVHAAARRRGSISASPAAELWNGMDVRKEVDRILLSKYSPAGVVVDEDLEVIEIRGKASPYLTLPVGKVSFNLMKLIPDTGLFLESREADPAARNSGEPARQERVPYEHDWQLRRFERWRLCRWTRVTTGRSWSFSNPCLPLPGARPSCRTAPPKAISATARSHG